MHDYTARLILSKLSGLNVNATTTQHAAAFLFGNESRPCCWQIHLHRFRRTLPGYKYSFGKSEYRGEDPGEGGYVYSEPGVYTDVALLDVASPIRLHLLRWTTSDRSRRSSLTWSIMHSYQAWRIRQSQENVWWNTWRVPARPRVCGHALLCFEDYHKHRLWNDFAKFWIISSDTNLTKTISWRSVALCSWLTWNMEVQKRGYTVAHIKTDSIKIPNADKKIIDFVFEYGKEYVVMTSSTR